MSKFSDAAYSWMRDNGKLKVSSDELWRGLQDDSPDLTAPSEHRKTPRATCMRDLRKDPRFEVRRGGIRLLD